MRVALVVLIVAVGLEGAWVDGFNPLNLIHNKILDALGSIEDAKSNLGGAGQKLILGLDRVKALLMRIDSFVHDSSREPQEDDKQAQVDNSTKPPAEKPASRRRRSKRRHGGRRDGTVAMVSYPNQQSSSSTASFAQSPFGVPSLDQIYQTNRRVQPVLPFPYLKGPYQFANRFASPLY